MGTMRAALRTARRWVVIPAMFSLVLGAVFFSGGAAEAAIGVCGSNAGFAWLDLDGGSPHCLQRTGVYIVSGQGPYGVLVNNTGFRVWFHQNANGTGWADCFSHGNAYGLIASRDKNPGNVEITTNSAACTSGPANVAVQCSTNAAMAFTDAPNECYYPGHTYNISGESPSFLTNATGYRVWLHQNPNGSGWADCFSNNNVYFLSGRDASPGNLQVTTNPAAC
jgi:hypothetical protein